MFRFLTQAFTGKKIHVRVPHSKGLPLTDENKFGEEVESNQWIGVDLDGTLAVAEPWQGFEHIGKPVPNMLKRVKIWIQMGYRVKILTARAQDPDSAIPPIKKWLNKHGFKYHSLLMGKPRGGNYHWIDNHLVKATRYNGTFGDLVRKEVTIEVFNDERS